MPNICINNRCDKPTETNKSKFCSNYCLYDHFKFEQRLREGVILNKDTPLVYENYKEPLKLVTDVFGIGFGYMGTVAMNTEKTHIQCHECGYFYKGLHRHVQIHGLTTSEYKEKYQLMRTTALIGEATREKKIKIFKNIDEAKLDAQKRKFSKYNSQVKAGIKSPGGKKGSSWTLEKRNKEGLCPDQLLEKIRELALELGHTPSCREMRKKHTRYTTAIITMYGSWSNAIKLAGFKPQKSGGIQKYTTEYMIECMRNFFETHGRVPVTSDHKRCQMPAQSAYIARFGGMNQARMIAGIPILVEISARRFIETMDYDKAGV